MNTHAEILALLPQYAAGQLDDAQKAQVDRHLAACADCRAELAFWQEVAGAVQADAQPQPAPHAALQGALAAIHEQADRRSPLAHAWLLLKSQVSLVKSEIWSASLLVLMLGFVITLLSERAAVFYAIAPVVSAAGLALIYGGRQDPAYELTLAAPTSQIEILLARSALVFTYNLLLTLLVSLGLAAVYSFDVVGPLISEWIAPMTFLSMLGLGLSVLSGSENAILVTYLLWLSRYLLMTNAARNLFGESAQVILDLWQSNWVLYGLSGLLALAILTVLKSGAGNSRQLSNHS
ncbi:MAG: hypothetical protein PWQ55_2831 [Chloroflexota bacterium]|nr:hypothetical protein [Chloroflexota bacterium]